MRISNRGMADSLLAHVQTSQARLAETQERLATGRRVNRPSDDPFDASRALTTRSSMSVVGQWQRNISLAHTELGVVESALERMGSIVSRAQELAVQGDSSALDAAGRAQIAAEVDGLIEEALSIANTAHGGRRIFAGHQTGTPPFVPDVPGQPSAVSFNGDGGQVMREIGDGERLPVNLDGEAVFGGIFEELISFRDALRANDQEAVGASATSLGGALDDVLTFRGEIGSRVRRVEFAEQRLEDEHIRLQVLLGELEEADLTHEIMELQMREVAFRSALASAGNALNLTLLDFLR